MAKEHIVTPAAPCRYVHVNKPDTAFGASKYKCQQLFTAEQAKPVIEAARKVAIEAYGEKEGKKVKLPFVKLEDEDDESLNGLIALKTSSQYKPGLFDARGNEIPEDSAPRIGPGSIVKLRVAFAKYATEKKGITAYLEGVQLIKLVEGQWAKGGFDDASEEAGEDAYTVDGEGAAAVETEAGADNAADFDDPIPF